MSCSWDRQAGFTALELAVAVAAFALLVLGFSGAFAATNGLSSESRGTMRAHEELRLGLDAVTNNLRDAELDSLDGFDAQGKAADLTFQRVNGLDASGGRTLGPPQEVRSQPKQGSTAGEMVLVSNGMTTVLASAVPPGGFQVIQEGGTLRVRLTTRYRTAGGRTATASGELSVPPRN